jgi:multicomponent Na+:H+ antiporter subunit B
LILYALVFGLAETMRAVPPWFAQAMAACGILVYAGTGVWGIVSGGAYLDFQTLFGEAPGGHKGQHLGIMLVELGVLMTVTGSMLAIFYALAGRVAEIRNEDW